MDQYEQAALDFSNEMRAKLGLDPADKLEPGEPYEGCDCPISNTVCRGLEFNKSVSTYRSCYVIDHRGATVAASLLSPDAFAFVNLFDKGNYPAYMKTDEVGSSHE